MKLTPRRVCNVLLSLFLASCVLPWAARAANNPIPLINTPLVPTSVAPGGADFTLTVNGTGFVAGSVIKWNGTALTTHLVTSSQLMATVPASDIASAGSAWITVVNPSPGGGASLPAFLRIATPVTTPSFVSYSQGTNFYLTSSLITGDFNGDGKLDLAFIGDTRDAAGNDTYSVCIALGNGNGSFQIPVCQQASQGQYLGRVVAGDFNGDGKLDLAVTNTPNGNASGVVSIYLGNGDGTLQPPINSPSGDSPVALAAGDFNRDGKLDLAIVNVVVGPVTTTAISVLLGNGDGTFQSPLTYASGLNAYSLVVNDFNNDGHIDIVVSSSNSANSTALYFLAGNGDGSFQTPQQTQAVSGFALLSAAADFNGDGKLDLFLVNESTLKNFILLGNGDGTFQPVVSYSLGGSVAGNICGVGGVDDLNADGKLDLAFCEGNASGTSAVGFQLGNGDGTFQAAANLPIPPPPGLPFPEGIVTGDFNGDGRVDLVTAMDNPSALLVSLQGSFPVASATPTTLTFPLQAMGTPSTPQFITLTNTGTITLTLSGVSIAGTNPTDFAQTNTCGGTLAGGATCQISVTFTPTTPGNPVATVNISDSAAGSPQIVFLAGSTLGPATSLSPSSVAFPNQYVGTSGLPQSVTLTNTGTAALTITKVATSPSDFGSLNACGSSLAAGASCAIGVFFDPTVGGARSGTLTITDNAGGSPQTVTLTGSGEDFSVAPGSAASASVSAGQTASYSVAVAPMGGFAQTVALSCGGAPAQSTCAVSPSTIALSGAAAQTVTVTVTTVASSQTPLLPFSTRWPKGIQHWQVPRILALAWLLVLMAAALSVRRQDRRLRWAPLVGLTGLVCLGMTLTSCGGGSSRGGGGITGTQAGTYTITVSGNFTSGSTNLTHNTKLTLVVQ